MPNKKRQPLKAAVFMFWVLLQTNVLITSANAKAVAY
jgi:hypothetical protein